MANINKISWRCSVCPYIILLLWALQSSPRIFFSLESFIIIWGLAICLSCRDPCQLHVLWSNVCSIMQVLMKWLGKGVQFSQVDLLTSSGSMVLDPFVSLGVHWQVSSTSCPTFACCWFSSHITSSILPIVFTLSFWLFSHIFLAASWDCLLFTLGLCFTSWLWDVIHFTCLYGSHPASSLARFSIPIPSVLFLHYCCINQMLHYFPLWLASFFYATLLFIISLNTYTFRYQSLPYMSFKFGIMPIFLAGQY